MFRGAIREGWGHHHGEEAEEDEPDERPVRHLFKLIIVVKLIGIVKLSGVVKLIVKST